MVEAAESNIAYVFCETSLAGHCGRQNFWRALQDFGSYCFPHKLWRDNGQNTKELCLCFYGLRFNRVRKVFSDLTDQNLTKEHFLKRKVKGEKRVERIIDANKQFGLKLIAIRKN